jgi:hypothetical protein
MLWVEGGLDTTICIYREFGVCLRALDFVVLSTSNDHRLTSLGAFLS